MKERIVSKHSNRFKKSVSTFEEHDDCIYCYDQKGNYVFHTDLKYKGYVSQFSWHKKATGYVETKINDKMYMAHRLLIDAKDGEFVDHINRDRQDNRLSNLRICTTSQNIFNSKIRSNNKSGVIGVWFLNSKQKWIADIKINNRKYRLGYFDKKEDAIECRKQAEKKHFGEFKRYEDIV